MQMRNPVSRFAYVTADMNIKRSQFSRPHRHLTTLSAGKLYPLLVDEVLPGDTFTVDMSSLIRMSTPIHPVMDNCYLDAYFFFVPNRIVWDHWKEFMGESPVDPYLNPIEYSVPQIVFPSNTINIVPPIPSKGLFDYLGLPAGSAVESFNALPVRGFCKIWNEWFRDQNLQHAINFPTGDSDRDYSYVLYEEGSIIPFWNSVYSGASIPPVNKYHDYFTSALKEPQKGDPVAIPLSGFAPVYANDLINISFLKSSDRINSSSTMIVDGEGYTRSGSLVSDAGELYSGDLNLGDSHEPVSFNNLGADLSNLSGVYATINDLRYAFQLQKFLEADNRGGTRYRELLKQHFNVTSPDASQQVPEFLGGKRIPINIAQVLQTSATNEVSPQGNTAAYSLTTDKFSAFTKSFTEHGFLFCVGCIRTEHTYQQGLERFWTRKNKFDYYFPEFANISEQPIFNKELYNPLSVGVEDVSEQFSIGNEYFGFQEAWADYRYKPNRVSGEFRSQYSQSLDVWHYADYYSDQPYLSEDWIKETRNNIDRTLAVDSDTSDQFICDFYFDMKTTRCMPVNSIPGLADHH